MKITIPGTLPSLNEIIDASKGNKYAYVQLKNEAITTVGWSALQLLQSLRGRTIEADFVITWYCPNKRKNKDNIMAGQKFIFDGLQRVGVLKNDGWKQIRDVTHRFEVDKEHPRVEIEIREVQPWERIPQCAHPNTASDAVR